MLESPMCELDAAQIYQLTEGSSSTVQEPAPPTVKPPPRLLDRVRAAVRARHYSRRTEKAYVAWIRRYSLFHGTRHPLGDGRSGADELPELRWRSMETWPRRPRTRP